MRRREFITLLGGVAAWVSPARAQEPRKVIGFLASASSDAFPRWLPAFVQGLKDSGFIEGNNINIEWRWAEGQYNRLPSLAGELVSRGVAVIVAWDAPAAFAAKAATKTIPIVFGTGADPVKTGLVDSLSRPGGNLTGVTYLISLLGPKRLELLIELLPSTNTIALLINPNNPNVAADAPETEAAANALRRRLEMLTASTEGDMEAVFTTIVKRQAGALVVMPDPLFFARRAQLVARTSKWNKIEHRLFSFITINCRAKPLLSYRTIIQLIAATTTDTGLKVRAVLDENKYPKGVKVSDAQLAAVNLSPHSFHGDWNYTVSQAEKRHLAERGID
jgi:putative ABC transport system substrate-binding protein